MKTRSIPFFILLGLSLVISPRPVAATGTVTMEAYFPAPNGNYSKLSVGTHYTTAQPAADNNMIVEGNVGIGTTEPLQALDVRGIMIVSGNVGVGTTTAPVQALDVYGRIAISGTPVLSLWGTPPTNLTLGNGGNPSTATGTNNTCAGISSCASLTTGQHNTAVGYSSLNKNISNHQNTAVGAFALEKNTADKNTAVGSYALNVNTNGTENVAVGSSALQSATANYDTAIGTSALQTTSGNYNVAIGYNAGYNPSSPTSVMSNIFIGSNAATNVSTNATQNIVIGDSIGVPGIQTQTLAIGNTLFGTNIYSIDNSGKIGINTASPRATLEVDGAIYVTGNVGIGTTAPAARLDVQGNVSVAGNLMISTPSGQTATLSTKAIGGLPYTVGAGTLNNTTFLTINKAVNITGYTSLLTDQFSLYMSGDVLAKGFYHSSDLRLKEKIQPIKDALNKIKAINGVTFAFKTNPDKINIGLIAQNVETVVPEVVSGRGDAMKSVAYDNLVGLLIEGIKDQQKQIEDLKRRLAKLEKKP